MESRLQRAMNAHRNVGLHEPAETDILGRVCLALSFGNLDEDPSWLKTLPFPIPAVVLDLLEAFRRSKTMFAAVSLGVFDAWPPGRSRSTTLAGDLHANADALGAAARRLRRPATARKRRRPVREHAGRRRVSDRRPARAG